MIGQFMVNPNTMTKTLLDNALMLTVGYASISAV